MYQISLTHYLILASIIFTIGIFGVFLNRKNLIIILMSIELMLLAVNINFIAFSTHLNIILGQVFALFILTVAAAEAAIGLAILVVFFRSRGTIAVDDANSMKERLADNSEGSKRHDTLEAQFVCQKISFCH